jgi:ABC-2 type transport system ATP-binding protein
MAILGPNGCGKSTAMHTMLGLIPPENGTVRVAGVAPAAGSPIFDRIAYLPEEPHYHSYLTIEEAVRYYSSLHRRRVSESKITRALQLLDLDEKKDLLVRKCSKGMKQKTGIAACLATEPDLLFLDEPMRGLDPQSVKLFRDELQALNANGATIVLNSHILAEVEMICTHAAIVRDGRVFRQAPIEKIHAVDRERYVVEISPIADLPDYFQAHDDPGENLVGAVPTPRIEEFFRFVDRSGGRVVSAQLSRISLEEAFLAVFESEDSDG